MSRIDEIRARCGSATPGPWGGIEESKWRGQPAWTLVMGKRNNVEIAHHVRRVNSLFIANAREDIPFLLDEIDRLQQALLGALQVANQAKGMIAKNEQLTDDLKAKEAVNRAYMSTVDLMAIDKRQLVEKVEQLTAELKGYRRLDQFVVRCANCGLALKCCKGKDQLIQFVNTSRLCYGCEHEHVIDAMIIEQAAKEAAENGGAVEL